MKNCSDLYFLSTLACKLSDCLTEDELEILASSLNTLGEMLNLVLARQAVCDKQNTSIVNSNDTQ